jgi:hypothetical protein
MTGSNMNQDETTQLAGLYPHPHPTLLCTSGPILSSSVLNNEGLTAFMLYGMRLSITQCILYFQKVFALYFEINLQVIYAFYALSGYFTFLLLLLRKFLQPNRYFILQMDC